MSPTHQTNYSKLFFVAGVYNIVWGAFSALYPQWLFRFSSLEEMVHPAIFQSLAMVVGVYGVLYLEVSRRPVYGFLIIFIGLLGKVLGPLGWLYLYLSNQWPLKSIILILTNDLIWWVPFLFYLRDSFPAWKRTF